MSTSIDNIKTQIELVKKQTDEFISAIDSTNWNTTPEVLETNMNWQTGHLILANYLHGIASISGPNKEVNEKIDVKKFVKFYGLHSRPSEYITEKPKNDELKKLYTFLYEIIWSELEKLKEAELNEETAVPNPGAKTKFEALNMLFKHQSWHNGQIAILKRVLNK